MAWDYDPSLPEGQRWMEIPDQPEGAVIDPEDPNPDAWTGVTREATPADRMNASSDG